MTTRSVQTRSRAPLAALLAGLVGLSLAACSTNDQAGVPVSPLTGETWTLLVAEVNDPAITAGISPDDKGLYTIRFDADGTWAGQADCNSVGGGYTMSAQDRITIEVGPSTMMACPPAGRLEASTYLAGLTAADRFRVEGRTMKLTIAKTDTFAGGSFGYAPLLALPTAVPSAAAVTPSPTPAPTPTPEPTATPQPTATLTPAATPKPTPAPGPASCDSSDGTITVTYPGAWNTISDVPEYACMAFDPAPIKIDPMTGRPVAAVYVATSTTATFDQVVLAATDTKMWSDVTKAAATVSGLPGTRISTVANGAGSWVQGTTRYLYVVDRAADGVLVIQTQALVGDDDFATNTQVVDDIAASIVVR